MTFSATLDLTSALLKGGSEAPLETPKSGIPFWEDDPVSWDTVWIEGLRLPGLAKVGGNGKRRHVKKNTPGKHGSTLTFTGDEPTEFTIHLRIWTPEHLADYVSIVQFLKTLKPVETLTKTVATQTARQGGDTKGVGFTPAAGGKAFVSYDIGFETTSEQVKYTKVNPVAIVHPALAIDGISQAFVLEFGLLAEGSTSGVFESKWSCIEFIPESLRANGGVVTPKAQSKFSIGSLGKGAIAPPPTKPSSTNSGPGL